MPKRYFQRGSGVFTCQCCGRRTRITTQDVDHICAECYDLAGLENTLSDEGPEYFISGRGIQERDRLIAELIKHGVSRTIIEQQFSSLAKIEDTIVELQFSRLTGGQKGAKH